MLGWIVLALACVGMLCFLYGALIEHQWFRLRRYRLAILPADGPPALTMLHLSDLHFVRHDAKKDAVPGVDPARGRHRRDW